MRMIPKTASGRYTSSSEQAVFGLLKSVPAEHVVCLHSLNLSEHEYQRSGEIDFVVIGPHGVLALEIKGGRVARQDGVWSITNRRGEVRREERGPFKQVETGLYSLTRRLARDGHGDLLRRVCTGYGVVFPDAEFDAQSVEWSPDLFCDLARLESDHGIAPFLSTCVRYWWQKGDYRKLGPDDVTALADHLRPSFVRVPPLRRRAELIEEEMVALTQEQYERLEVIEEADRILCSGGAGTGKTFLAVEVARRERSAGRSVAIVCHSRALRDYIAGQADLDGIAILTAGNLHLPAPVETLIVDEGQDLLTTGWLDALDQAVTGGLESGRWRIFLDPNNQANITERIEPEALEFLEGLDAVHCGLRRNCRNTTPIVEDTRLLTGADIGIPTAGDGPAPITVYSTDETQGFSALAEHLDHLMAEGIATDEIVILSCRHDPAEIIEHLPSRWRQRVATSDAADEGCGVVVWPVADFKGLEAAHVCLVGVSSLAADDLPLVYVGMTRARVSLWIQMLASLRNEVRDAARRNAAAGALAPAP
jgi:hypothetical protein